MLTEVIALADKSGVRTLLGEAFEYQQTVPFFSLFMATLRADPPVGDAEALRRLGSSVDLRYWVVHHDYSAPALGRIGKNATALEPIKSCTRDRSRPVGCNSELGGDCGCCAR